MTIISDNQREDAYQQSSDLQKDLYEGKGSAKALYSIAEKHLVATDTLYTDFLIAVGDVILDLVPQTQLPQLLIERLEVDQTKAEQVTADVLDFLAPLQDSQTSTQSTGTPIPITTPDRPIDVELNQVEAASEPVVDEDTLAQEIAETEAAFHTLQPIRTMAHDMQTLRQSDGQSHQAVSQEELLQRKKQEADESDKRWGTTQ